MVGEHGADLVEEAGGEADAQEGGGADLGDGGPGEVAFAAVGVVGVAGDDVGGGVFCDAEVGGELALAGEVAVDDGEVAFGDVVPVLAELVVTGGGECEEDAAGGGGVDAVDDAGAVVAFADALDVGEPGGDGFEEGVAGGVVSGVDGDACGFVGDEPVGALREDVQGGGGRGVKV